MDLKKPISSININQDTLRLWGRRLGHEIKNLPLIVFIRYGRWVNIGVALVVAAMAIVLVVQLLYLDPPDVVEVPKTEQRLLVQAIDHLEFWLEEREARRQSEVDIPRANVLLPPPEGN